MKKIYVVSADNELVGRIRPGYGSGKAYAAFLIISILFFVFTGLKLVKAQPTGGPYGPVTQAYNLPDVKGRIFYVAPEGKAENPGNIPEEPTTIEEAVRQVKTGDAIIMRGGIYRTGELMFNQGITIQAYADEKPVLKGTYVADKWQNLRNGLWKTSWTRLFPNKPDDWWIRDRAGRMTPLHRFNNDMVFVDGRFLQSAGWINEVDENSFYIDYETKQVYIGVDPEDRLVEITAFDGCINRTTAECHGKISDKKGPVIRGITFTQYARRAIFVDGTYPIGLSGEADHGKDVTGTTIEHCDISYCSRVATRLRGDSLVMRHCKISNTSTEGVYIEGSSDVLLEKNIFTKNNIELITGYYPAAVKIFNQSYRVTCNDNLIIDHPFSNGIWYDVGNVDGVFINNWVENVGHINYEISKDRLWPSDNGFFFEISKGVICAGNVFVNCDHGLMILNSSDARIYQNTFVNSIVSIGRTDRSENGDHFGWHPSTGPDVDERDGHIFVNNLLTADDNFNRPLMVVWQPPNLCERLNKSQLKQMDFNVYMRKNEVKETPLIIWSPAVNERCQLFLTSPEELQKLYPESEVNSRYFAGYKGSLFRSYELGNYQIMKAFPGSGIAAVIPDEIQQLLRCDKTDLPFTGAYPPMP
jgi:hypothetical protein